MNAVSGEDARRLDSAIETVYQKLESARVDGHWVGELSPSALSTATAISALSFYLKDDTVPAVDRETAEQQIEAGLNWLAGQQNHDGGFGDTSASYSNISTSMLAIAAVHASEQVDRFSELLSRAEHYVASQGSIEGLRKRYGKDKTFAVPILANCAMAGIVPWREVSALPFEAACVPQKFYHLMQLPVVSYAIPALVAIGQAKFIHDPPWDPFRKMIRKWSIQRSLKVLEQMQPASGGYLEAVPLTSFVVMALAKTDRTRHPVVQRGVRFLLDSFRAEATETPEGDRSTLPMGSWPIDTNLATWSTTLTVNAFANWPERLKRDIEEGRESWQSCYEWILSCQYETVHPFTGSQPGGWGWTDLTGSVPDSDDTPGALLALKHLLDSGKFEHTRQTILRSATAGARWLLDLQNRDRGWPTFCRGWGKLPFDRSGSDLTAHAIRALSAWQSELLHVGDEKFSRQISRAIETGFDYLSRQQRQDGSWLPLWFGNQDQEDDINPFYGTAKVICAYRDANRIDTQAARFGLNWVVENQNPDGGWGGGMSVHWPEPSLGNSSIEETALCTEALLSINDDACKVAAQRGVDWLVRATESGCIERCTPIGFYFAKLWYYEQSYPLIFAASALARAKHELNNS
ncbi:MAG: prenyltransferase/squalene oxidase repeat-containing protein [Planctomycetota bacterium]